MGIKREFSRRAPEPVLQVARLLYSLIVGSAYRYADHIGIIGPDEIYSAEYYKKRREDPWRADAHSIARGLNDEFNPESIIDFGCAIGAHLEPFYNSGIDVRGVEGSSSALEYAVIPTEFIDQHDLREPYGTSKNFDLVISFEVAEHIPEQYADNFVDTLTDAGDLIIMTAAEPGQAGTHHVNNQPRKYWIEKLEKRGFIHDEGSVSRLQETVDVEKTHWVLENLFVFQKNKNG